MSHGDVVRQLPEDFSAIARSSDHLIVAFENQKEKIFGLQYHPEVSHSEKGMETLKRFLMDICGLKQNWTMENLLEIEQQKIRERIEDDDHAICALSGGVDSAVAAVLVHGVIGDRLHCVFVDNGLLRYKARYSKNSRYRIAFRKRKEWMKCSNNVCICQYRSWIVPRRH